MLRRLKQWLFAHLVRHKVNIGSKVYVSKEHLTKVIDTERALGGYLRVPTDQDFRPILNPELKEWLVGRGPCVTDYLSVPDGYVYFLHEQDAVEFKLSFL